MSYFVESALWWVAFFRACAAWAILNPKSAIKVFLLVLFVAYWASATLVVFWLEWHYGPVLAP